VDSPDSWRWIWSITAVVFVAEVVNGTGDAR
jgi:hypothetical protein